MAKTILKTTYYLLLIGCWLGLANFSTSVMAQSVAIVNAASYAKDGGTGATDGSGIVTPEGLASAFGTFNITAGQSSYSATPGQALPKVLGGVRVRIGTTDADLLFVGTTQINLIIPTGTATGGLVDILVTNANGTTVPGKVRVELFAPGIFSAKTDGKGVAAADWTTTGQFPYAKVYDLVGGQPVHATLDAGTKQKPTYLVLYASGVRGAPDTVANDPVVGLKNVAESCTVTVQGVPAKVDYAGRQPDFFGLDQINVVIPPEVSGLGILTIRISIKSTQTSRISNDVEIKVGGQLTPLDIKDIALAGGTATGALTPDDAIEMSNDPDPNSPTYRKTYFIDVYRFRTTAANTTVAIDLRANLADPDPLDTQIIVRKVEADRSQTFFAADDQGGGFGNCPTPPLGCKPDQANNNSLLLTLIPEAGEYWIFVTSADVAPNDTGTYTLKLTSNVLTPLAYGQTVNGSFSGATKVQTAAGVYVDGYYFNGREGESIRITMRAPAPVDAFLQLRERNGDVIAFNDNGAGGTDAQLPAPTNPPQPLILPVNTGLPINRTFIIVATPLANFVTGSYTLQLEKLSGLEAAESDVNTFELKIPSRVSNEKDPRRAVSSRAMLRRGVPKEQ